MTIRQIELYPVRTALTVPFVTSRGALTHADQLFICLRTACGREGWGEAAPFPTIHGETLAGATAIAKFLAPLVVDHDPTDPEGLHALLDRALYGNRCVKSAFDLAAYDLASRAAELPLYRYLGGRVNRPLVTDYTVGLGPETQMAAAARELAQAGYTVIKVKLGDGAEQDIARLRAVRAAIGPEIPLRIDANQGWSFDEAVRALNGMRDLNVQHCEEPIDRHEWTRLPELRRRTPLPLMADESCWDEADARRLLEIGAVDAINIKLSKSGGLLRAGRIAVLAAAAGIPLQVGGFLESRLGFTAAAHFALAAPAVRYCDFDTPLMQTEDPVSGGITYGAGGRVTVPEAVGLGAALATDRRTGGTVVG